MPISTIDASTSFVLGPGRSGTTLFYKLLALHPDVGYFNNYMAKFGGIPRLAVLNRGIRDRIDLKRWSWFDTGGGAYADSGRPFLRKTAPTPSECEPLYSRCGVPDTPPSGRALSSDVENRLRSAFEVARASGGTPTLVSKRTANNRRVFQLHHAFPRARFISIIRDGRAVASSLLQVNWWSKHVLYWNGKTPEETVADGCSDLEIAARNWLEEMQSMQDGLHAVPKSQRLEIRYEELLGDPRWELTRALTFIGIDPERSSHYWDVVKGLELRARPESWKARWTESEIRSVEGIQGSMLTDLNYKPSTH